ncbi:dromaiocalcin-1-like [Numida meleagris]|uniref:dromaiocalcin-1-like n=1 Tax=Numida meleagris TaxID=8996 RepID=UPI000B3DDAA0|nr:dromaiocalcin-1-like [Numida meleagris]XP_021238989.1 dromaiocalcin-1-like [Numida meleagris]
MGLSASLGLCLLLALLPALPGEAARPPQRRPHTSPHGMEEGARDRPDRGGAGGGAEAGPCPEGWLQFRGSCYGLIRRELSWRRAEAWCKVIQPDCHLASLHSAEEHQAVAAFIAAKQRRGEEDESVWIGLHYRSHAWLWADGSKKRYSAWEDDENPKGQDCAVLEGSSGFLEWDDDACAERKPFVCKYNA